MLYSILLTISLIFAGDAMQHTPQITYAQTDSTYDYSPCFQYILPYLEETNLNIVNLETTLADAPYTGYPLFSAPDEWLYNLKKANFHVFTLANNHIIDKGQKGLEKTICKLSDSHTKFVGAYLNNEQRAKEYPLIQEINGIKIALFNVTYGTNGNVIRQPNIINTIDTAQIRYDIEHTPNVDLKIMFIHWGNEYQLTANKYQQEMAKWLVQVGFDLIIGSHPHVVQNADFIDSVPVVYSLGNFISNQRWKNSNGGIMLQVDIDENNKQITNIGYLPVYVHKGYINNKLQYYLIPTSDYLRGRLEFKLPLSAEKELKEFHELTTKRLSNLRLIIHPLHKENHIAYPVWYFPLELPK